MTDDQIVKAIMFAIDWCSHQEGAQFGHIEDAARMATYLESEPNPTPEDFNRVARDS